MTTAAAVCERPILFSGRLVRAILEDRKTVTRRVVKPQPNAGPAGQMVDLGTAWGLLYGCLSGEWRCHYGAPGDRLWVRESWQAVVSGPPQIAGRDRGIYPLDCKPSDLSPGEEVLYRATDDDGLSEQGFRWRPSIHMPRWASRILLEVTEVRVERLQEMTPAEAVAEGAWPDPDYQPGYRPDAHKGVCVDGDFIVGRFRGLWDQLHAPRGYGWDANPWVWVIRFRRVGA